jgi:osmotically-inducible protein OsmY
MIWTMRIPRTALVAAALAGAFFSFPAALLAAPRTGSASAQAQAENPAADSAAARLNKAQYHNVKVSVDQGIATLTGSVDLYEYKADAEKRVRKAKGITAVRNLIDVAGPIVSDKDLQSKLAEDLAYDRVGWGDAAFNAITVGVNHSVVTLGGHARTDVDKDSALALVATTHGVKDVVDDIEVDPVSIMDDGIRREVARAIYGYSLREQGKIERIYAHGFFEAVDRGCIGIGYRENPFPALCAIRAMIIACKLRYKVSSGVARYFVQAVREHGASELVNAQDIHYKRVLFRKPDISILRTHFTKALDEDGAEEISLPDIYDPVQLNLWHD